MKTNALDLFKAPACRLFLTISTISTGDGLAGRDEPVSHGRTEDGTVAGW